MMCKSRGLHRYGEKNKRGNIQAKNNLYYSQPFTSLNWRLYPPHHPQILTKKTNNLSRKINPHVLTLNVSKTFPKFLDYLHMFVESP